ncbi:hypothetical protein J3S90_09965 [Flavobacterium sp. P4023]|uniref:Rad50/SbcC-type AAA domain-containing protein n=1 Tax=Flavobacterium flabelliforme TaxID=2816119 RepID=A0ABS5CU26_9FLAO|nr:SbcC/MukB-like Walker B domain-containing protein [Flavobacterium flabelliforme]MBP4142126.1 hypothetical protein [Flavobacterium flabelliforme]
MLPLKLSITGLYSYQKKQTIDFEELTNAGLFGIFGAVGSGKSSVLEAIGFVLYGETDRLNKTDKRAYNMLNLKSDRANIEFEFLNYQERKFKFVADWKRKKRFEETTSIERLAYEWKDEQWIPLNSADATTIIGLTYENFRRTIIIPQGKFNEFLGLKGKERSDMMKEIFHLERFDLTYKVSALQKETSSKLDFLRGELSGFEAISTEAITTLQNEVISATAELQEDKTTLILAEKEVKELAVLKANFEDLEKKKEILSKLNLEKVAIDALQLEIDLFEKTERNFKANLIKLKTEKTALEKAKENLLSTENQKKVVAESNLKSKATLEILQPDFDKLDNSKSKFSDLESIEKIRIANAEVAVIDEKIKAAEGLFLESEKKEKDLVAKLDSIHNQLVDSKKKRLDASFLLELGTWYQQELNLKNNFEENYKKQVTIQKELNSKIAAFQLLEVPFENWKTILKTNLETLSSEKEIAIETKTKLLVSKELVQFAENLHDGENCPLCGSQEHPHLMQGEDVSNQLEIISNTITDLADKEAKIILKKGACEKLEFEINHFQEQLKGIERESISIENQQKTHFSKFIWSDFDPKDSQLFEAKKAEQQLLEKEIIALEVNEKEFRKEQETIALALKNHNSTKNELETKKASKSGAIENELSKLKVLSLIDYEAITLASIQAEKIELFNKNLKTAEDYKFINDAINKENLELSALTAVLKTIQLQVVDSEKALLETQKIISELLQEHHFSSVEEVRTILIKNWNLEAEKEKVKLFAVNLQTSINSVSEAEKLLIGKTFDSKLLEEKTALVAAVQLKYETQLGKVSTLQDNLQRMNAAFVEKAELLNQSEVLNARFTNLGILANMFNASGFVNYVSSIYLQNLADVANVRFHRMTKNQLSLTINSSNEFEVIDYLNDGASRSVKTLSGGQGFQASLCLALALAESVQSLNKNDKNFFFIDEGFGTQDPESISIVFETLQSLYKENRIVGIISHVGELQERIPRSVNVIKDEEKGSIVSESWI